MANEQYKAPVVDLNNKDDMEHVDESIRSDYLEETSAEIAAPIGAGAYDTEERTERAAGTGVGWLALILSILSLFFAPVLLGATGIILGFVARGRGASGLGSWAIGIGVVSIILRFVISPFF